MIQIGPMASITPAVNLTNISSCVPQELFIQMLPYVVMKDDAIKLGLICFVAGMITMSAIEWIDKRWTDGNS
jgi:hypothetical protein